MHRCVKCKRVINSIDEVKDGCSCGSKVFVYLNEAGGNHNGEELKIPNFANGVNDETKDKRTVILELENIRLVEAGVYEIDVNSLSRNPVVVKDEDGVYYIRLPYFK